PRASAAAMPRRLVIFFSSNGTVREKWLPRMDGGGLVLSEILQPLEPHRSDLLVVDGLGYRVADRAAGDGHYRGMNAALTGSVPRKPDPTSRSTLASGISLDQWIAQVIGGETRLRSLECGVAVDTYAAGVSALSYAGAARPLLPENDPRRVFERVFGQP